METMTTAPNADRVFPAKQPRFSGISHISLPCRELEESKVFYSHFMSGELVHETAGFIEYKIEDISIGLSGQSGGWTGGDDEYPHHAFFIEAEDFLPMVDWLRQHGMVTTEPWSDGIKGLLYFRDPAGNLFEMYCRKLDEAGSLVRGAKQGGSYSIDFDALYYPVEGLERPGANRSRVFHQPIRRGWRRHQA